MDNNQTNNIEKHLIDLADRAYQRNLCTFHFLPEEFRKHSPNSPNRLSVAINSQNIGVIVSKKHSPSYHPIHPD